MHRGSGARGVEEGGCAMLETLETHGCMAIMRHSLKARCLNIWIPDHAGSEIKNCKPKAA